MIEKKLIYKIVIFIGAITVIVVAASFYNNRISKEGIYKNVLNQDGYYVYEIQKPIHFTTDIKPEWIPTKEGEVLELNEVVGEVDKVSIIIENVIHRGNDIYFNFDAIPLIKYEEGKFLYNAELNEDGTSTSYNNVDGFRFTNKDKISFEVGQRGFGPEAKFSFGINVDDYDLIKDGFTFEYNSSILYGYSLADERRK